MRFLAAAFLLLLSCAIHARESNPDVLLAEGKLQLAGSLTGQTFRIPIALEKLARAADLFVALKRFDDANLADAGIYWCIRNSSEEDIKKLRTTLGDTSVLARRIERMAGIGDAAEEQKLFDAALKLSEKSKHDPLAAALFYETVNRFGSEVYKEEAQKRFEAIVEGCREELTNFWNQCDPRAGEWQHWDRTRVMYRENEKFQTTIEGWASGSWKQEAANVVMSFSNGNTQSWFFEDENTLRESHSDKRWARFPMLPARLDLYRPSMDDTSIAAGFKAYEESIAECRATYVASLKATFEKLTAAKQLNPALAVRTELERIENRPGFWRSWSEFPSGEAKTAQTAFHYAVSQARRTYGNILKRGVATRLKNVDVEAALAWREEYRRFLGAPAEAIEYNGQFYVGIRRLATWPEAREWCERTGGMLSTVEDATLEKELVKTFADANKEYAWWIGLYNVPTGKGQRSNVWRWVSNQTAKHRNFTPGEPDNHENKEDVVLIVTNGLDRSRWSDRSATDRHWFFCEWGYRD